MLDELTDQLRRYGDAVEERALRREDPVFVQPTRPTRHVAAIAAVLALFVLGGLVLWTRGSSHPTDVSSLGPETSPTSRPTDATITITGAVTWLERDARAELRVAACPEEDAVTGCPSMRSAAVAEDGTFTLDLPAVDMAQRWSVVAYVPATKPSCVFNCRFPQAPRNAVLGDVVTVTGASASHDLALSISARVVDVLVRDRSGEPFAGGGVQVTDARCSADPCPSGIVSMFVQASAVDGAVRLVVDPGLTYVMHGQATNTGWSDPAWTNDGNTFWFSPDIRISGSDLSDGYVFRVDGEPATLGA